MSDIREEAMQVYRSLSPAAKEQAVKELTEELPELWLREELKIFCQAQADDKAKPSEVDKAMSILTSHE